MTLLEELYAALEKDYASLGGEGRIVPGEGPSRPRLVLIGEAPGEQEALQGRPFVGKAGKNLNEFLQVVGLPREEIYITNVVKIRPWKRSKAGNPVNRPPSREEKAYFIPWLKKELEILQPGLVVTLGNVALGVFRPQPIGEVHGRLLETAGGRLYPLYHPASVIYNPSLKEVYREDLLALKALLAEPRGKEEAHG